MKLRNKKLYKIEIILGSVPLTSVSVWNVQHQLIYWIVSISLYLIKKKLISNYIIK